jgi:hypothetical protein
VAKTETKPKPPQKSSQRPRAIIPIDEFQSGIIQCFYGPVGMGKTPLAAGLPRSLFLMFDRSGAISAQGIGSEAHVWPMNTWNDFIVALKWIEANLDAYDWIVIDTVTMMQTVLFRDILKSGYDRNPEKRRDEDIAILEDHQWWQAKFKRFVLDINALPLKGGVVWLAQEMMRPNAEGDDVMWPLIPGGKAGYEVSSWFCSQMDVLGYLSKRVGEGKNPRVFKGIIFDEKNVDIMARDRTGAMPAGYRYMDGDKVVGSIRELVDRISPKHRAKLQAEKAQAAVAEPDDEDDDDDDSDGEDQPAAKKTATAPKRRSA